MPFDAAAMRRRLDRMWSFGARFGLERQATDVFLNELVSDRYALTRGLTILRDELQLAGVRDGADPERSEEPDVRAFGADLSIPSVVTTIAHTNCGDRIHQGEAMTTYRQIVAGRFATLSEIGELKVEAFSPTGGGTDDGATLAHVTVGHQLDEPLRRAIYEGNQQSCALVGIDLMAHVGRLDEGGTTEFGRSRESRYREPRAACGAIVGALTRYNPDNGVHRRLRRDLGEENFAHLLKNRVATEEGVDMTPVVAAAIIVVQGMRNVLNALARELDARGVGHVTASLTVNRVGEPDTIIYLGRGTAFGGELETQGFGCNARRFRGRFVTREGDRRLDLLYDRSAATGTAARPGRGLESSDDALPPMGRTLEAQKPDLKDPTRPKRR